MPSSSAAFLGLLLAVYTALLATVSATSNSTSSTPVTEVAASWAIPPPSGISFAFGFGLSSLLASSTTSPKTTPPGVGLSAWASIDYAQHMLLLSLTNVPKPDVLSDSLSSTIEFSGLSPVLSSLNTFAIQYLRPSLASTSASITRPSSLDGIASLLEIDPENLFLVAATTAAAVQVGIFTTMAFLLSIQGLIRFAVRSPNRHSLLSSFPFREFWCRCHLRVMLFFSNTLLLTAFLQLSLVSDSLLMDTIAVGMVGFVFIVFSGYTISLVSQNSDLLVNSLRFRRTYGPLFTDFSFKARYFLIVDMVFKVVEALLLSVLFDHSIAQLVCLGNCRVLYAIILSTYRPLTSTPANLIANTINVAKISNVVLLLAFVEDANEWIRQRRSLATSLALLVHTLVLLILLAASLSQVGMWTKFSLRRRFQQKQQTLNQQKLNQQKLNQQKLNQQKLNQQRLKLEEVDSAVEVNEVVYSEAHPLQCTECSSFESPNEAIAERKADVETQASPNMEPLQSEILKKTSRFSK